MRGRDRTDRGRGWGPFSGRQLTTIACVAIVAMVTIPTAALAAAGAFTSNSATPAVTGTNTSAAGIGVQGTGQKYGVYSNGPLGVAAGKSLHCTGCVAPGALSSAAKGIQPLTSGQSETGVIAAGDGYMAGYGVSLFAPLPFVRPVAGHLKTETILRDAPVSANCPGPGKAAKGYLCLYLVFNAGVTPGAGAKDITGLSPSHGWIAEFLESGIGNNGGSAFADALGSYTVTAP